MGGHNGTAFAAAASYGAALAALAADASYGTKDIVSLLLDRGADINAVGGCYGTALAAAASHMNTDIVLLLLRRGVNLNLHLQQSPLSIPYTGLDSELCAGRRNESLSFLLKSEVSEPLKYTDFSKESSPSYIIPLYIIPSKANRTETLPTSFRAGGIITPAQANVSCQSLSEKVLTDSLVALVGLHEHAVIANSQWIQHDVNCFISCDLDFGLAYSAARVGWKYFDSTDSTDSTYSSDIPIQRLQLHTNAKLLNKERLKAIQTDHSSSDQELIISPYSIMPRRIWDLKSNRVVDFRMLHAVQSRELVQSRRLVPSVTMQKPTFWAVSHSWTSDMSPVLTRINQYQWPVPLPKDISLDHLRSELLDLGAEYVWVDVVCLRQQTSIHDLELLRREEWKLDVPTIGNIYRAATHIVRYFNGLGVPFSNNGWDNPRHWLQRAWTLQEIADEKTTINGGIPHALDHVFLNSLGEISGKVVKLRSAIRPVIQLAAQVDSEDGCEVYKLVQEMIRRHASQPLDKLSGLFYLLGTTKLPCYDDKMTSEDIWRQCFHLLPLERKTEILFDFPYRGTDNQWFPTWAQMLSWPVRDPECDHMRLQDLNMSSEMIFRNLWIIPRAVLFKTSNPGEYKVRVRINNTSDFYFYLPYLSQKPIDLGEPEFALAIADLGHAYNWVVCRVIESPTKDDEFYVLKKVGVMRTDSCSQLLVSGLLERKNCRFI